MNSHLLAALFVPLSIYALAVPTPGPCFALIAKASLSFGRRAGMAAALGTTAGMAFYAAATILGVGALVTALPWLLAAVQIAGGTYLIYLGGQALHAFWGGKERLNEQLPVQYMNAESLTKIFIRAMFVSLGNPKIAAFFFGIFATVTDEASLVTAKIILLAGVIVIDLVYHQILANLMALEKARQCIKKLGKKVDALLGSLMAFFGIRLVASAIKSS